VRRFSTTILIIALLAAPASSSDLRALFENASREEMDLRFPAATDEGGAAMGERDHSKVKAFLLSALLPGLGQRYNESVNRSRFFFVLEAAIWSSFVVWKAQEHWRTDDFEEYAAAYAGAAPSDVKDTEFYRIMTIYDNSDEYNEAIRIEARSIYPPSQYSQEVRDQYLAENGFGEDRSFQWRANDHRLQYRLIRNDALDSGRRADYALVAAVLNRAISAVEAARNAGRLNKASAAASHIRVTGPDEQGQTLLRVGIARRF